MRGLSFEGNRHIPSDTLAAVIATSQSSWFARTPVVRSFGLGEKRFFDETEFRRDVIRLMLFYRQSGYLDVRVDTLVRRSPIDVHVTFVIAEGPPVRIDTLDVTGAEQVIPAAELRREIPLRVGDPFNRFLIQASADTIRSVLQNRGYPFVQVFRNFDVDRDRQRAAVHFAVDPGPLSYVDSVIVLGTQAIDPAVIRRTITLRRGQPFSRQALYDSQLDLYRMGVFNFVTVALADSAPTSPDDSLVTVRVQVAEGSLHRLRFGSGYGTVDCFRGSGGWTAQNFAGGGRVLDLSARISKIGSGAPFAWGFEHNLCSALSDEDTTRRELNYNVTATLRQPFLFNRRTSATISTSAERRSEFQAYVREAVGGEIAVTQQTRWHIPVTVSYQLSYGRTVADPAIFCSFLNQCSVQDTVFSQRRLQSTLGLGLVRDRTNAPLDPTRGSTITADARYAARAIGSDSLIQFAKGVIEVAAYEPLDRYTVFAWRVRVGSIVSPRLGLSGQAVQFVPPQERFYGGGPTSVRGFGQNQLGPLVRVFSMDSANAADSTFITSPTGGNQLLFANAELRFPTPFFNGRLRGALFVDMGQVFERSNQLFSTTGMRVTPGAGLRVATPLGPVRLDVAYNGYRPEQGPLYERVGNQLVLVDPSYAPAEAQGFFRHLRVNFSVGQAF